MAYQDNVPQRFTSSASQTPSVSQSQMQYSSGFQLGTQQNQIPLRRSPSYQSGDDASYCQPTSLGNGAYQDQSGRAGDSTNYNRGGSQSTHGSRHSQIPWAVLNTL
ncbi:hypothetical protein CIHG_02552 [Coccidioides immitis H538.4]|uniref:Uncharacterized protein n=1 Tax=Coccidioides immitis H538.4 TaxID=396776 RepID=A0A0J8RLF3_COCIT|nr:hypothetical protein CIHG_02552 [Coccidioides immitis H538.4]